MILIPSRNRPLHIKRLAFAYMLTHAIEPVCILVDDDQKDAYENIATPSTWQIRVHGPRTHITEITNRGFAMFPNEEVYGVLADDVYPQTDNWDVHLKQAAAHDGVAWGNDGIHGINLPTHIFMGGDLARALGWVSCPVVKHWYADNIWLDVGRALGTARYVGDCNLEHLHPLVNKGVNDRTYAEQPNQEADRLAYERWKNSGEFRTKMDETRAKLAVVANSPFHAAGEQRQVT